MQIELEIHEYRHSENWCYNEEANKRDFFTHNRQFGWFIQDDVPICGGDDGDDTIYQKAYIEKVDFAGVFGGCWLSGSRIYLATSDRV